MVDTTFHGCSCECEGEVEYYKLSVSRGDVTLIGTLCKRDDNLKLQT